MDCKYQITLCESQVNASPSVVSDRDRNVLLHSINNVMD